MIAARRCDILKLGKMELGDRWQRFGEHAVCWFYGKVSSHYSVCSVSIEASFAPGEAYQFDWSHEIVLLSGLTWP